LDHAFAEAHVPDVAAGANRRAVGVRVLAVFVALDDATGKTLWSFKTGSSLNATAVTYTYKGRQYVSVASGLGGSLARRWAADKVPAGGSMWTFAVMPD